MRTKLTAKIVRDAHPAERTYTLRDTEAKGLGLRVTTAGGKAFVLDYRAGGRQRVMTLAQAGDVALAEARALANRERANIRLTGNDPLDRRQDARDAPTVAEGLDDFFAKAAPARIAKGRMSPRTAREYRLQADKYLRPALGRRQVASVTRRDIEKMVDGLPKVTHNRVLAFASRLFRLFEDWEWRPQHTNPCRGIERAREQPRDRTLAPAELAALATALDGLAGRSPAAVAAIRFAAVTGLRIGEVLGIKWEDVEFETGRLTLPETKTGRRQHDLPSAALAILSGLHQLGPWAFTTAGDVPITYKTAAAYFGEACRAAGLADVRLHDLRRTVMTCAAAAGVGAHILRDLLGHKSTVMADRYVRAVGNPVRDAREQVAARIAAAMGGEPAADVLPMRPPAAPKIRSG